MPIALCLLAFSLAFLPQADAPKLSKAAKEKVDKLIAESRRVIDADKDVQSRIFSLNRLAALQVKIGDREAGRRTYKEAATLGETVPQTQSRFHAHILDWTAQGQMRAGFREDAIETLRKLLVVADGPARSEGGRNEVYLAALKSMVEAGDGDGVQELLEKLAKYYEESRDFDIIAHRARSLIQARSYAGDFEGAMALIEDARTYGNAGPEQVAARRRELIFVIVHAIGPKNRKGAEAVLKAAGEAVDLGDDPVATLHRIQERSVLVPVLARLGLFDEAMAVAEAMRGERIDAQPRGDEAATQVFHTAMSHAAIAEEALKAGNRDLAVKAAKAVREVLERPGPESHKAVARERAMVVLATAGDLADAKAMLDRFEPVHRLDLYATVARGQRAAGDEAAAKKTLLAGVDHSNLFLRSSERRPFLLARRAEFEALLGDLDAARTTAKEIEGESERDDAYRRIAGARASLGDIDGALAILDALPETKPKAEMIRDILTAIPARKPAP